MSALTYTGTLVVRNGTIAQWEAANPILAAGEIGLELDTEFLKIGDGITPWNSLTYSVFNSNNGVTQPNTDNSTQLATTAFVQSVIASSGSFVGALRTLADVNVTPGPGINGYFLTYNNATSKWVASPMPQASRTVVGGVMIDTETLIIDPVSGQLEVNEDLIATTYSPAFTGTPTAPTAATTVNNTQLATTAYVQNVISTVTTPPVTSVFGRTGAVSMTSSDVTFALGAQPIYTISYGVGGGTPQLDSNKFVLPANLPPSVQGTMQYQATWNASTNTPHLTSGTGTKGAVYKVSVVGSTNLDGNTSWNIGDFAVFNGASWDKFAGGASVGGVASFNTRTGSITLTSTDVTTALGFTPYDSANPNSYIAASGAPVQSVAGRTGAITLTTADVSGAVSAASPAFTGTPTAPTATAGTNTTQLATTAFVASAISAIPAGGVTSFNTRTGAITLVSADVTTALGFTPANSSALSALAPLASPTFTGTPVAPTATAGTNTTQLATTAFVTAAVAAGGSSGGANTEAIIDLSGLTTYTVQNAQAANACILFTGTLSAACTVSMPGNGSWSMSNSTSGGFIIQVKAISTSPTIVLYNGTMMDISVIGGNATVSNGVTASLGDNSTALATTAFVKGQNYVSSSALTTYAPLASPVFTGAPLVPTATAGTNTTQAASTAFVATATTGLATLASPTFTGTPTAPTATAGTNTTQVATTAFVTAAVTAGGGGGGVTSFNTRTGAITLVSGDVTGAGGALLASPTFTGVPAAPTATAGTNTTQLATTAFVTAAIATGGGGVTSFNTRTGAVTLIATDISNIGGAMLASPAFTGTPTAPTATAGTNTGQLATTQFVNGALGSYAPVVSPTFVTSAKAPTPTTGDNSTNIATTAFVAGALGSYAPVVSPTFVTSAKAPTPTAGDNTTNIATTAFVSGALSAYAPVVSPIFVTSAKAPTPTAGDSSTNIATTAFVANAVSSAGGSYAPLASPAFTGTPTAPNTTWTSISANSGNLVNVASMVALRTNVYNWNVNTSTVSRVFAVYDYVLPIMVITGAPAANLTGTLPVGGTWTISNQTTGAFTITLKVVGLGTTGQYVIPQGQTVMIYTDATSGIIIPTAAASGVTSFNTRTGAVTLTSSDVTTALTFTPANAASLATVATSGLYSDLSGTPSLSTYAPLASPALTGTPTAPTATAGTNTTQVATTAFVTAAVSGSTAGVASFNTRTGAVTLSSSDVTTALTFTPANVASPTFTGTPVAPTAALGTNTTQLATTAFVKNALTPVSAQSTVTYSATLTLDCTTASVFDVSLTGNITLSLSGGVDGQKVIVRLKQDATGSRTLTWGSMVAFGTDITATVLTTTASKMDYIGLVYNAAATKYHVVSFAKGF